MGKLKGRSRWSPTGMDAPEDGITLISGRGPRCETRQPRRGYCCKAAFQDGSSVDGHRCINACFYERVCTMTAVADFAAQRQEENSPRQVIRTLGIGQILVESIPL